MVKIFKEIYSYLIIIFVVILFRFFIATPVRVSGSSMDDTLHNGDILILNKMDKSFDRFDVVVIYKNIAGKRRRLIKRIIGLPGESIEYKDNELYINGEKIEDVSISRTGDFSVEEIPKGQYFVMGDNRNNSSDSRESEIGFIKRYEIIGTTKIRLFPFNKIGKF